MNTKVTLSFSEIAENVHRTCNRNWLQPPFFEEKNFDEKNFDEKNFDKKNFDEKNFDEKNFDEIVQTDDDLAGVAGDRPDFVAWKVAIKKLNQ
jgi:uncharacterized protein YjbI with pentapeptide repeats